MMTPEMILELLGERATKLRDRAKARMSSIFPVIKGQETEEQRKVVNSAQADYEAAEILSALIEEIEYRRQERVVDEKQGEHFTSR